MKKLIDKSYCAGTYVGRRVRTAPSVNKAPAKSKISTMKMLKYQMSLISCRSFPKLQVYN
jgi:hypothetical protein